MVLHVRFDRMVRGVLPFWLFIKIKPNLSAQTPPYSSAVLQKLNFKYDYKYIHI